MTSVVTANTSFSVHPLIFPKSRWTYSMNVSLITHKIFALSSQCLSTISWKFTNSCRDSALWTSLFVSMRSLGFFMLKRFLMLSSRTVPVEMRGPHKELGILEILTCSICLWWDDRMLVRWRGLESSTISVKNTTDFLTRSLISLWSILSGGSISLADLKDFSILVSSYVWIYSWVRGLICRTRISPNQPPLGRLF